MSTKRTVEIRGGRGGTHRHHSFDPHLPVEVVDADDGGLGVEFDHVKQMGMVGGQHEHAQRHQHHVQDALLPSHRAAPHLQAPTSVSCSAAELKFAQRSSLQICGQGMELVIIAAPLPCGVGAALE